MPPGGGGAAPPVPFDTVWRVRYPASMKCLLIGMAVLITALVEGSSGAELLDTTFNAGNLLKGKEEIHALAQQADGKLLVGTNTTNDSNGKIKRALVRLTPGGRQDTAFSPSLGWDAIVHSILTFADGRILVGGEFKHHLVMLNSDGSLNDAYRMGGGAAAEGAVNGPVRFILPDAEGKVIIAGDFTKVGVKPPFNPGVDRNGIARLNADGSVDMTFDPGAGISNDTGYIPRILAIARDTVSDQIYLAGHFSHYNGTRRQALARLDANGLLDTSFAPALEHVSEGGIGNRSSVHAMAVQADGRILLSGWIRKVGKERCVGTVRLERNGMLDKGFNKRLVGLGTGQVDASTMLPLGSGKILVYANGFDGFFGATSSLYRLNADGSLDKSFRKDPVDGSIDRMLMDRAGRVVLGGTFDHVAGEDRINLARIIPSTEKVFAIRLKTSSVAKGSVSGGGSFIRGKSITVRATPKNGARFTHWSDGRKIVSKERVYRFRVGKDRVLTAWFK